jgi:hypothetical protein
MHLPSRFSVNIYSVPVCTGRRSLDGFICSRLIYFGSTAVLEQVIAHPKWLGLYCKNCEKGGKHGHCPVSDTR